MDVVDRPLIVCVSSDVAVRERLVRQLDPHGVVLICADLEEVRAILFPPPPTEPPPVAQLRTVGDLVVDPVGYRVTWRGEPLPLTGLERRIMGCLADPPLEVWTYQRLFGQVWGGAYLGDTSILHSAVKRLRGKLREAGRELEVETVRGVGYRLVVTA